MLSVADYEKRVRLMFGVARGDKVLAQYPASAYPTPRDALVAVTTDFQFTCPTRAYLQAAAAHPTPAYRYVYSQVLGGASALLGAAHGIELYFVFQKLERLKDYTPTAQDLALQQAILGYWTRFAATGDPNGAGAVPWPRYQASSDPYLELKAPVAAGSGYRKAKCDFWETL